MESPVILLGLGFTTRRLARRLLARRVETFAAVRNPERFAALRSLGLALNPAAFPPGAVLIHTIPPLPPEDGVAIREQIHAIAPRRVVYISSTGVYGTQTAVDETTPVLASDDKARVRIEDEQWLQSGPWECFIARAAAIYGPGRGIHLRLKEGRLPRAGSGGVTSRIHADDLAALLEAAAFSSLTGAWPVADEQPCATSEIARWCVALLGLDPAAHTEQNVPVWGRHVEARKVRELLGMELRYPTYHSGVLACLAEEAVYAPAEAG